jgi:hypothetical protein
MENKKERQTKVKKKKWKKIKTEEDRKNRKIDPNFLVP